MEESLGGNIPSVPFDYVAYNANAVAQFYAAIGLEELVTAT